MAGREISYCAIVLSEKTLSPEKRKDTKHNIIWLPKNLEEEKERDITLRRAKRAKREREDPSGDYQQFRSSDEPLVLLLNNPPRGRNVPWGWRPPFILSDWPVLPCHLSLRLREIEKKEEWERMLIPSLPVATFKVGVHHISNASNCSSLRFHSSFFFKKRNTKFYLHICTYLPDNYNLTRQLFLNSQVFFFSVFPLKFFSLFLDFCLWLSNVMDVAGRVGARCPAVAPCWTQDITHTTPWLVLYPLLIPDYKERQPGPKHTPTLTQKSSHIERETMVGDSRSCLRARATFT
jgi:hypothetical protein